MQMLQSPSVRRCWVWYVLSWIKVHVAGWLQEETLQADFTKLILESESDAHSSEDVSAQSDSNTGDTTDTDFTQRTDNTYCWPTVPVVPKFIGGSCGLQQTEAPHINKDSSPLSVFMHFFFESI
jgi:hypothetical protein